MKIVISSGHGKYVRGASGYLDEVDEARRVVEKVAGYLRSVNVDTTTFHDDTSHSQNENLSTIVNFHNAQGNHDLDISVHFNAYQTTSKPMGTECLYVTQEALSGIVADKISDAGGFINRGPKYRSDLYFLNNTKYPAILIEVCFVDSSADANAYGAKFSDICCAIAEAVSGIDIAPEWPEDLPPKPEQPPPPEEGEPATVSIVTTGDVVVTINGQPVTRRLA
jgi:N-acetylmuramoyl-L-alanine amidase